MAFSKLINAQAFREHLTYKFQSQIHYEQNKKLYDKEKILEITHFL